MIPNASGKLNQVLEVAVFRNSRTRFFTGGMIKACSSGRMHFLRLVEAEPTKPAPENIDPALAPEEASEPHDNFAVAEGMRHAIVEVWAADTSGEMNKWISDSGISC